ncbi:unnamed protein product [Closterium sp. NIES-54]
MVQQVLQRFDFTYSSPQATPLTTRHSLSALPSDESVELSGPYPELVGCLMYLMTCTRPDLAYHLSILERYVAPGRHRPEHMAAAKRVLRYLCSHADASWADDQATQRSSQGYTFSLGSGSELRWLTFLLTDLGEQPRSPPVLYVDNKAMLALCREHRLEHRTKHIALRYFPACELQQRGQLRLAYVASEANTADVFTKALAPGDHQRFCTLLGFPTCGGHSKEGAGPGEGGRPRTCSRSGTKYGRGRATPSKPAGTAPAPPVSAPTPAAPTAPGAPPAAPEVPTPAPKGAPAPVAPPAPVPPAAPAPAGPPKDSAAPAPVPPVAPTPAARQAPAPPVAPAPVAPGPTETQSSIEVQLPRTGVCAGRVRQGPAVEVAASAAAEPATAAAAATCAAAATTAGGAGAGGAGARGAGSTGASGTGGDGAGGIGTAGAARCGGTGGARAGGAGGAGATGGTGTASRRPFFFPQPHSSLPTPDSALRQILSLPSSTGLTPPFLCPLPLLCPPPDQSQPQ